MSQPKILVVDDEQANLKTIFSILKSLDEPFRILTATNGRDACRIAEIEQPDLIIMDWEMPEMNGIEATLELRRNPLTQDIPVIIATGKMTEPAHLKTALKAGAHDYVRKPIEPIELLARIDSALRLARSYARTREVLVQLDEKHRNVMDSINYARRIQAFVLPEERRLEQRFPDSFILYMPRDIVSGDFYWFHTKRNQTIFVAGDCTGHGVPGAFMSLLGINALNQILRDYGSLDADLMLAEFNERIGALLKQGYSAEDAVPPMDGMDVALAIIDTKNHVVQFAGAGRPLYFVRNGQLEYVRGAHYPIGGTGLLYQKVTYERHEVQLATGDCIYMFSDGYTDQFNQEDKRKFGAKRFREILQEIHPKPMIEQSKILKDALLDWKGDQRQTDDISVYGLRMP